MSGWPSGPGRAGAAAREAISAGWAGRLKGLPWVFSGGLPHHGAFDGGRPRGAGGGQRQPPVSSALTPRVEGPRAGRGSGNCHRPDGGTEAPLTREAKAKPVRGGGRGILVTAAEIANTWMVWVKIYIADRRARTISDPERLFWTLPANTGCYTATGGHTHTHIHMPFPQPHTTC